MEIVNHNCDWTDNILLCYHYICKCPSITRIIETIERETQESRRVCATNRLQWPSLASLRSSYKFVPMPQNRLCRQTRLHSGPRLKNLLPLKRPFLKFLYQSTTTLDQWLTNRTLLWNDVESDPSAGASAAKVSITLDVNLMKESFTFRTTS